MRRNQICARKRDEPARSRRGGKQHVQRPWGHDVAGMLRARGSRSSSLDLRLFYRPQGLGPLPHLRQKSSLMAFASPFCSFAG